jgi:hypothetical protein
MSDDASKNTESNNDISKSNTAQDSSNNVSTNSGSQKIDNTNKKTNNEIANPKTDEVFISKAELEKLINQVSKIDEISNALNEIKDFKEKSEKAEQEKLQKIEQEKLERIATFENSDEYKENKEAFYQVLNQHPHLKLLLKDNFESVFATAKAIMKSENKFIIPKESRVEKKIHQMSSKEMLSHFNKTN